MPKQPFLTVDDLEKAKEITFIPLPEAKWENETARRAIQKVNASLQRKQMIANGTYPQLLEALDAFEARLKPLKAADMLQSLQALRERLDNAVRTYIAKGDEGAYLTAIAAEDEVMTKLCSDEHDALLYFKMFYFEALHAATQVFKAILVLPALLVVPGFLVYDVLVAYFSPNQLPQSVNHEKAEAIQKQCMDAFNRLGTTGDEALYEKTIQQMAKTITKDTKTTCQWFETLRLAHYSNDQKKWLTGVLNQATYRLKEGIEGAARLLLLPASTVYQEHTFFAAREAVKAQKNTFSQIRVDLEEKLTDKRKP